ncbi:hypothetical protein BDQ17DRAFT_1365656 [Cyathus striatus]|nr:hypothetical protein BDQ17DRAFT_1365656 [Cyathus striatus]
MLYDGLGYLVMLTAVNILNLVLYRTSRDVQNAGLVNVVFTTVTDINHAITTLRASLGYCVSWIMSQRLLIHLHSKCFLP